MPNFTHGVLPLALDDASRGKDEYYRWRAEVLQRRFLPEYKIKRLWRENYSLQDIEAGRHYALWPRMAPGYQQPQAIRRGRAMSWRSVQLRALCAARAELKRLLRVRRFDKAVRAQTMALLEQLEKRIFEIGVKR